MITPIWNRKGVRRKGMVKMQKKRNEERWRKRETRHITDRGERLMIQQGGVIVIRHNITKRKEEFIQDDRARAKRETGCSNSNNARRGYLYIKAPPRRTRARSGGGRRGGSIIDFQRPTHIIQHQIRNPTSLLIERIRCSHVRERIARDGICSVTLARSFFGDEDW